MPRAIRSMRHAPLVVLLSILVCGSLVGPERGITSGRSQDIVPLELNQKALAEGVVRVIVHLSSTSGPMAHLNDDETVTLREHEISATQTSVLSALANRRHRLHHRYQTVPLLALELGPDALHALSGLPGIVERIEEDTVSAPHLAESVPVVFGGASVTPQPWAAGFDGTGQVIAILDTGVDGAHPFLFGKVIEEACFSSGNNCPNRKSTQLGAGSAVPCPFSGCSHGTHVAGIAAGSGFQFSGVAPGARIMAIQVFSRSTDCGTDPSPCIRTYLSDTIAGLERVYTRRKKLRIASVNMSLGDDGSNTANCDGDPRKLVIDNLRAAGIATVISSGNNGYRAGISAPACISSAVSVGSTTVAGFFVPGDQVSTFSNSHPILSLLAPGQSITSSVPGGGFASFSGTSMAAPHVSGAWAIVRHKEEASVSNALFALQRTGVLVADGSGKTATSKPRIQINQALDLFGTRQIISPLPGSTLKSDSVKFIGDHTTAELGHWLTIGNSVGGSDLVSAPFNDHHSVTVSGLPLDGRRIHVRYWTQYGSGWQFADHSYWMAAGSPGITSPPPGSTLSSSTVTFTGKHKPKNLQHWLEVGTDRPGSNSLFSRDLGIGNSATVFNIPERGTVYVRYWSRLKTGWTFTDQDYIREPAPFISSPSPGTTLGAGSVTFSGSHTGMHLQHFLFVGTSPGAANLLYKNLSTGHSAAMAGLPLGTIYVRYWTRYSMGWAFTDQTYSR